MRFPQQDLLASLERLGASAATEADASVPAALAQAGVPTAAVAALVALLTARKATLQAAFDTALAADELRRYQKFAKPGRPSAHIVQLRQKQAAARQATSLSRQSLIKAAAAFVRDAGIEVPERVALNAFIIEWIGAKLPGDDGRAA
ncbi:hypothetical protein ACXU4B_10125 [Dyella soli]